jgi:hypothetical protein
MAEKYTIDHTSSYRDLVALLALGRDADGNLIDVKTFDRRSAKTKFDLFREVHFRDVIIRLNEVSGRVERIAKNVSVIITNPALNLIWFEVSRRYPSGVFIPRIQEFTIRETRKIEETPLKAAIRGLAEELNFWPRENEIRIWGDGDVIHTHESTVYEGVRSVVTSRQFEVKSDAFFRPKELIVKDYGEAEHIGNGESWVESTIRSFPTN